MGFGLWIDKASGAAWAKGTHEYRPMGAATVAMTDQFRPADFRPARRLPTHVRSSFAGFFGSLEELNHFLRKRAPAGVRLRPTPSHVR